MKELDELFRLVYQVLCFGEWVIEKFRIYDLVLQNLQNFLSQTPSAGFRDGHDQFISISNAII